MRLRDVLPEDAPEELSIVVGPEGGLHRGRGRFDRRGRRRRSAPGSSGPRQPARSLRPSSVSGMDGSDDDARREARSEREEIRTNENDQVNVQLGEHLRRLRKQKGLSLLDVQSMSEGEFKASVMGAYERGERAISAVRLARARDALPSAAAGDAPARRGRRAREHARARDRRDAARDGEVARGGSRSRGSSGGCSRCVRTGPAAIVRIRADDVLALASAVRPVAGRARPHPRRAGPACATERERR